MVVRNGEDVKPIPAHEDMEWWSDGVMELPGMALLGQTPIKPFFLV
jgi:hypothetical protein